MWADTVIKKDKSPVTVADLSAQALISLHLIPAFPKDEIIGEEDTSELRRNDALCDKVVSLVNEGFTRVSGPMQNDTFSKDQILDAIDKGSAAGGPKGRFWTIVSYLSLIELTPQDPVDGTSGFIRHQQYAVCLALIVDGEVELGVIGCPNLGPEPAKIGEEVVPNGKGVLMVAVRGEGSYSRPLTEDKYTRLTLPPMPPADNPLTFLESVEAGHSAHGIQKRIGELLGVQRPSLRMDSQAKYACLARGEGGVYLRIPTKYSGGKEYQEKVWDHASGALLIAESGGVCSDMRGKPLDFTQGRTLKANEGIVAAGKEMHEKAVKAVQEAVGEAGYKL
ncbi:3'(2'),5'-bisphosphate nucleotidase [Trichosporon asahii var. asahii CBS 8904]|uniref:3'(2'),5'-bisphosphate nucleotidase n=2 Tax=Trichosporon asahii var. asahii TaxID=189963 RepID=K1VMU8_TRIAC|nr:3'(2'),5'-bisphosphate nucleotidase [Trichosporon asahii var. asahii CBS 2479]EJT52731.1 3'(2'),5'-bisphosphate nucleotidase [Trichosporon asahii var. asahii CBS 2479]EKD00697.1 3'(2'),5'-bisphosphate nucleotidase [Trichosporon asahii var. asahii CBS 8904]